MEISMKSGEPRGTMTITWNAEASRRPSALTLGNRQQIDVGGYDLHSLAPGEPVIGHLFVVAGANPGELIEHWALRMEYVMPGRDNPAVSMKFAFHTRWDDLEKWKEDMATIPNLTYIVATCVSGPF